MYLESVEWRWRFLYFHWANLLFLLFHCENFQFFLLDFFKYMSTCLLNYVCYIDLHIKYLFFWSGFCTLIFFYSSKPVYVYVYFFLFKCLCFQKIINHVYIILKIFLTNSIFFLYIYVKFLKYRQDFHFKTTKILF